MLNLYLVERAFERVDYSEDRSAVVAANGREDARNVLARRPHRDDPEPGEWLREDTTVTLIGVALSDAKPGVVHIARWDG